MSTTWCQFGYFCHAKIILRCWNMFYKRGEEGGGQFEDVLFSHTTPFISVHACNHIDLVELLKFKIQMASWIRVSKLKLMTAFQIDWVRRQWDLLVVAVTSINISRASRHIIGGMCVMYLVRLMSLRRARWCILSDWWSHSIGGRTSDPNDIR